MISVSSMGNSISKNQAFALMEALITLLVITIGLLGYAGLQIAALNSSMDSFSRSQAVTILDNAATRIRANKNYLNSDMGNPNAYVNNATDSTFYTWCSVEQKLIPEAQCANGESCLNDKRAGQDIYEICQQLVDSRLATAIIGASCFDRDTGGDSDNCSAGSRMSLYMAWKGMERQDISGKARYQQNTRCQSEIGLADDYACVQLEIVP